jgi:Cysteine-rich secretory protein family
MKHLVVLGALIAALVISATPSRAESSMLGLINAARSGPPLASHAVLSSAAAAHSARMAERDEIFHSSNLSEITTGWEQMGENVGVGVSIDEVFRAFMASGGHRANILGDYTHAGVGTFVDADGLVWVTVIFMRTADTGSASTSPTPPTTTSPPTAPSPPSPATVDRRHTWKPSPSRFGADGVHPIAI